MKFYIRQKIFALFDEFEVYSEDGNVAYKIKNHGILSHEFAVFNVRENKTFNITESIFRLFNQFKITTPDITLDICTQKFHMFKYVLEYEWLGWTLKSSMPAYSYNCYDRSNNLIFTVKQKIFSFTDYYEIDIINTNKIDMAIIMMICMDALECNR